MNNKVSFISGNFITAHLGHIRLFKYSKKFTKELVVGVYSDKLLKYKSPVSEKQRLRAVKNNKFVTKAVIINESLEKTILKINPSYVIKGAEFKNKKNLENKILKKIQGKLIFFSDKSEDITSNYLINKNINFFQTNKLIKLPNQFLRKHKIKISQINKIINDFKLKKICVIGDVIVDEYIDCETVGISQEDSTLVVRPNKKNLYVGGAGIVASHASGLGASVDLYSFAGNDTSLKFLNKKLKNYSVNNFIDFNSEISTHKKTRYIKNNNILFRVNDINSYKLSKEQETILLKKLKSKKNYYDLVIFSDFNYGCLSENIIKKIQNIFKSNKIIKAGDSQSSSQTGDIKKFKNFDLVTATEYELRLNMNDFENNITFIANKFIKNYKCKNIIIKLGKNGIFIHSLDGSSKIISDSLGALNPYPKNISGAGDAFLVASSLSISSKSSIWEASIIGSLASALQISREGNVPISNEEISNLFN